MGTKVAVTLDTQKKPNYVVSTQAAIAFAVAAGEMVIWIGSSHGQGKGYEVSAIRACLNGLRQISTPTPSSGQHSYAKLAAPGLKKDVAARADVADTTLLTGTVTVGAGTKAVVGVGTTFLSDLTAGQTILIGSQYCVIDAITTDLALTITANHTAGAAAADYSRIAYTQLTGTMTITAGTKAITGVGTAFDTEVTAGTSVILLEGEHHLIATVTDATDMDTTANHVAGAAEAALTGTVSVTAAEADVVGVGTAFTTELVAGESVMKIGTEYIVVQSIADDTNLVLASAHTAGASGATAYLAPTADLATPTLLTGTVSITAGQKALVGVGTTFTADLSVGDVVKVGTEFLTVATITDATNIVTTEAHVAGASGADYYLSNVPAEVDVGIWYGDLFQQTGGASITPHVLRALEKYLESTQKAAAP